MRTESLNDEHDAIDLGCEDRRIRYRPERWTIQDDAIELSDQSLQQIRESLRMKQLCWIWGNRTTGQHEHPRYLRAFDRSFQSALRNKERRNADVVRNAKRFVKSRAAHVRVDDKNPIPALSHRDSEADHGCRLPLLWATRADKHCFEWLVR